MTVDVNENNDVLLIKVPPGIGKTTAAVNEAQRLARNGKRILYVGSRHNFFDHDIVNVNGFEHKLWYHWLPMNGETCRYIDAVQAWMRRGHAGIRFCAQLCTRDDWMHEECPYRQQKNRSEPIVFAMHQHLTFGLSVRDFDVVFVDELPLQAFINERHIPASGIMIAGATGVMGKLVTKLNHLATEDAEGRIWRGKPLLDEIGELLTEAYEEISLLDKSLRQAPRIYRPETAYDLPYFYILELLRLLVKEHKCWQEGWESWVSRVSVSPLGIKLLNRREVWEHLPYKTICLDATGSRAIYAELFGRDIIKHAPVVERPGKIYQIVGRLNGISTILDDGEPRRLTKSGREMLRQAQTIAVQYSGRIVVVTFKDAVPEFAAVFGELNVMHFGAIRGTNQLEDADCLIVAGGYCPPLRAVKDTTACLFPERMEPFIYRDEEGNWSDPWRRQKREYSLMPDAPRSKPGLVPRRTVSGFWDDPQLNMVLQAYREEEIVQAMHRVRPNLHASHVWVLTSIPTDEPLDAIYETLNNTALTPGINWKTWFVLEDALAGWWAEGDDVTAEMIATAVNVTPGWVENQKWLHKIAEWLPDHWLKSKRKKVEGKRGPGKLCITPVKVVGE